MKPESVNFQGTKVLVVEDNPINQIVTQENLEKLGCMVELASSGEEALAKYASGSFDYVLMDVQMPINHGWLRNNTSDSLQGKKMEKSRLLSP